MSAVSIRPGVIASRAGDHVVLSLSDGKESVILNRVGSLLWDRMVELPHRIPAEALVTWLCKTFPDLSAREAVEDVEKFLRKLASHELVSTADEVRD